MATRDRKRIVAGPGKWDLIVGFGEIKSVEFTFEGVGRTQVRLQEIGLEDGGGNRWLITASMVAKLGGPPIYVKGYYDSQARQGWYQYL